MLFASVMVSPAASRFPDQDWRGEGSGCLGDDGIKKGRITALLPIRTE
tara:strand:+ start:14 stop:157 length:144 start_codon:yes stop_codon:yes gene_type:complete